MVESPNYDVGVVRTAATVLPVMAFLASGWAPTTVGPGTSATATVSPSSARAKKVELVIRFRTELQCGRLNARSLEVRLPSEMQVPTAIPRSAVIVSERVPGSVRVQKPSTIHIAFAPPRGVTCMAMAPGTVTIRFVTRAKLGNPAHAGRYPFSVAVGRLNWRGELKIR